MKAIVNIRTKTNGNLLSENLFNSKKEAMNFINNYPKKECQMIFGNYKTNGKNFYSKFN